MESGEKPERARRRKASTMRPRSRMPQIRPKVIGKKAEKTAIKRVAESKYLSGKM